ncbi:Dps family protein [Salmonirosea aquatica]|uniref:DNA starvation/stationary phase protection protein n=1 Tax=Salmonirosea aquatica TaxID=2654236 RepID=A0A7C9BH11_9BACT|nr:DNA starvation/stationary phase protection protein [Cytophagaceae bacterium SJW1-29]
MKTTIGITDKNRQAVAEHLHAILADEFVLYTKTRNAHWNVEGADFYDKHLFFEKQYNQLADMFDRLAERIRFLGHYTPATLKQFLELTHLTEMIHETNDSLGFIKELNEDHNTIITEMRKIIVPIAEEYKDQGTSDFITGLMEEHEKMAWILRSHLR